MSKEREDFIAWYGSNPEQDEHGNYTGAFTQARWETWQAATAHYQPLLEAKDAEISLMKNTLRRIADGFGSISKPSDNEYRMQEEAARTIKTLAAINAATGKGE
jgi:hypothetical protein